MAGKALTRGSSWMRLQDEVNQTHKVRCGIIKRLERRIGAKIVSLFISFHHRNGLVSDDDAEALESMLSVEHKGGRLVLILNAPGGIALAAERIVNVCRAYSDGKFEVVVPHMAKSAATMICFGASKIHMGPTAELGPVDPQVAYVDDAKQVRWLSAEEYVRAYDNLLDGASNGKAKRIEPFLQQLQRFDAREIESLKSAQALSKDISVRLLKTGMMKRKSEAEIGKSIEQFLSQRRTSSHGRMISHLEAEACGLVVERIKLRTPVWTDLWELFVRSDWTVSNRASKLLESSMSSLVQAG